MGAEAELRRGHGIVLVGGMWVTDVRGERSGGLSAELRVQAWSRGGCWRHAPHWGYRRSLCP